MTVNERIRALRTQMREAKIDVYLLPSSDDHQSEYVAPHWQSRAWLSGFTGSTGLVIVTRDHAGLWTDSRYFLQAETQLAGTEVELHKLVIPHTPEHINWLRGKYPNGAVIGADGRQMSVGGMENLQRRLGKSFRYRTDVDLIGTVWKDRPTLPDAPVFEHDLRYTGKSRAQKMDNLRKSMPTANYLVTALDNIAWLLNLRGSDVESNPLFYSYLLLRKDRATLFVDPRKISEALEKILKKDRIEIAPYGAVGQHLAQVSTPVHYNPQTLNLAIRNRIPERYRAPGENLIALPKATKNDTEIAHLRRAMERDGVALLRLFRWLEARLAERTVTEYELAIRLAAFRRAGGQYHDESFPAIVGYRGNGAIVHYRPEEDSSAAIRPEGILLLDSGGQYHDGTTDITRTVALGTPGPDEKLHYTLVLKGHIGLGAAQFPRGTTGSQLDALARAPLWAYGLNYGHGTGHGVGFFLNVHEGPQSITPNVKSTGGKAPLVPGMVTSNEPGFYRTDHYGIRIENLVLCVEGQTTPYGRFLRFEDLTLFPMDRRLIDVALLTATELDWLNDYHAVVLERLSPHLEADELEWLQQQCAVLER